MRICEPRLGVEAAFNILVANEYNFARRHGVTSRGRQF